MRKDQRLTFEIVRDDSAIPDEYVDAAAYGLERVRESIDVLDITKTDRVISIDADQRRGLQTGRGNGTYEFHADIGIILTRHTIEVDEVNDMQVFGRAFRPQRRKPFAVVDTSITDIIGDETIIAGITSHEASHTVGVKKEGEHHDGKHHCTSPDCVMQPIRQERLLGHCQECTEQLAYAAFNLITDRTRLQSTYLYRRLSKRT